MIVRPKNIKRVKEGLERGNIFEEECYKNEIVECSLCQKDVRYGDCDKTYSAPMCKNCARELQQYGSK